MTELDLDAIEKRADVPALVAALRAERAKTQRVRELARDDEPFFDAIYRGFYDDKSAVVATQKVMSLLRAALEGGTDEK